MVRLFSFILVLMVAGPCLCNNEIDVDKIKSQLPNELQDVDIDKIKSQIPEGVLNTLNDVTIEDAEKVIKDKCLKSSGNNATYEEVKQAAFDLSECVTGLLNVTELEDEIRAAQPKGDLDTVFNKYCLRRHTAIDCLGNFSVAMEPCLEKEEIDNKKVFMNIFTNLLNFVCHKDGDQIALFIAEKGPECFKEKKDAIITCVNETFYDYLPENAASAAIPNLVMGPEQCRDMDSLQDCVVKVLEGCEESTPANLVDSAFKFIRKETPCVNVTRAEQKSNTAADIHKTSLVVMGTVVMAFLARILL